MQIWIQKYQTLVWLEHFSESKLRKTRIGWPEHSKLVSTRLWLLNIALSSNTYFENYIFSGYMPPEYARSGHFSTKSDVFSYGVIVLEIVSGKKNREFSDPECNNNPLGYVSIMNSQTCLSSRCLVSLLSSVNHFTFNY